MKKTLIYIIIRDGNLRLPVIFILMFGGLFGMYCSVFYITNSYGMFFSFILSFTFCYIGVFASKARNLNLKPFAKFNNSERTKNEEDK